MNPKTHDAYELIHNGLEALARATQYGMSVDVNYCKKMDIFLTKKIIRLKEDFFNSDIGKVWKKAYQKPNINSSDQFKYVLFEKMKIESVKNTKKGEGNKSTDSEVIQTLAKTYPELEMITKIRKYEKVQGTYIQGFMREQVNGIMHPDFNLHTTISFRSSSRNPNFQNIPKRDAEQKRICRKAIIPRPGCQLVAADFSGIEVAISACYNKDPNLLKYIRDESTDMHRDMCIQIFMLENFVKEGTEKALRNATKNSFVFPQFYGDYYGNNTIGLCKWAELPLNGRIKPEHGLILKNGDSIGKHLNKKGIKTYNDFENHVKEIEKDFWENRFKIYNKWKKNEVKKYNEKGLLYTKTGFTCSGLMDKKEITNYPIQGSAFHCLLKTFTEVGNQIQKRKLKSRLIGQIHDEMVFNVYPDELEELIGLVQYTACVWLPQQWKWIIVPLRLEVDVFPIDGAWASDAKTIKLTA